MFKNFKLFLKELEHKYIYQRPSKIFRKKLLDDLSDLDQIKLENDFKILERDGILILPDYFQKFILDLKKEFENLILNFSKSIGKSNEDDNKTDIGHYSINNKGLMQSHYISKVALDEYLTRLISYYWGKSINLAQAGGTRLEPLDINEDYRSMQWHHDTKYKQIKVFVLLTDINENQQCTHYVPGTHKIWKSKIDDGRRTREFMQKYPKPVHAVGNAGTVVICDTNGYHRGNRNNTVRRDLIVFNYTAGRYTFPIDFPNDTMKNINYYWLNKSNLDVK